MTVWKRCPFKALVLLFAFSMVTFSAYAAEYPNRPVTWVDPHGAGSATDVTARLLSEYVSPFLGQRLLVENRAGGAGGMVGTQYVLRAAPDGYTIIVGSNQSHAVSYSLFKTVRFDPRTDFEPVALLTSQPQVVVIHPSLGIKSVTELVTYAKANPGKLNYASTGVGTGAHLAPETFKKMANVDIAHIPYTGGGAAIPDLLAGRAQLMFYPYMPLQGHIDTGKLVAIATTGHVRVPWLPNLPTMIELGYKNFAFPSWYGVYAPKGTPAEICNKLSNAFRQALDDPKLKETLAKTGTIPFYRDPVGLAQFTAAEVERYKEVLTNAGVPKLD